LPEIFMEGYIWPN